MSKSQASTLESPIVLLTGATGYVGGLLLKRLSAIGCRVRIMSRNPAKLTAEQTSGAEVMQGDVLDAASLPSIMQDVSLAYYLVHSMGGQTDFAQQDRAAAANFGNAAKQAGTERIVYLGGLGDDQDSTLSPHLRSRQEVGRILRDSGVETIEFRASAVLGSGSLSYDMIRMLTNRLPIMICPRWLATPTQPIAIDDLLDYLLAALRLPPAASRVFEIGASDVVTYGELIQEYARQRGLRRWLISVPVLTPYLSGLWLGIVTPATAEVGRHLIEGLRNPTVVNDRSARAAFNINPMSTRQAIARALKLAN